MPVPPRPDRRRAAFTLIEMLAVVLILVLMATFVAPQFSAVQRRRLHQEAMQLAAILELARQRTVVTGVPHRVFIDIDDGSYQLEWLSRGQEVEPVVGDGGMLLWPEPEYDLRGSAPIPLAAPPSDREYVGIPGEFGEVVFLDDALDFARVETPEGWLDQGQTFVGFDRDGTAAQTQIVIEDEETHQIVLGIEPLADAVAIWEPEA